MRRGDVRAAAKLAVPAVPELVRYQVTATHFLGVKQETQAGAIFTGLVVFQANARVTLADGQQEVVMPEMFRAIQLVSLAHHLAMLLDDFRLGVQLTGTIGHDVHVDGAIAARIQVEALVVLAGQQG